MDAVEPVLGAALVAAILLARRWSRSRKERELALSVEAVARLRRLEADGVRVSSSDE